MIEVALVGNPNTGKTTVFNQLTGSRQRIGNWAGVTVERKSGQFIHEQVAINVVDLPGIYSLHTAAVDERIASDYLFSGEAELIINVVDASHLERSLYLTLQLLEMGLPLILAVNMTDVAHKRQLPLDLPSLARQLGCPVIALEASRGKGIAALRDALAKQVHQAGTKVKPQQLVPAYDEPIEKSLHDLTQFLAPFYPLHTELQCRGLAVRLLEGNECSSSMVPELQDYVSARQSELNALCAEDIDIMIADTRYQLINQTLLPIATPTNPQHTWSDRIDAIVLNRVLGVPIFFAVMYLMFVFAINFGGAFQDFFEIGSDTIFVHGAGYLLQQWGAPTWLIAVVAAGIGMGITTTLGFIPVIGGMFLFLSLLEGSGYMARAAFVMDRFMRAMGLPGKSFVPLIVGFGCNVPSVMAARTLENPRDRILTVMMAPFMSCGARLAIYAVFIAAFFPSGGQNIVFALYFIGISMAVLTGLLLRKTLLKTESSPLLMELPPYHRPNLRNLWMSTWQRLKAFLFKAGKVILPLCVIIGFLNGLTIEGGLHFESSGHHDSLLSLFGQAVTPVFSPMGITNDNWPATVGIATGMLAKEVVVATLNTLYMQVGHLTNIAASVNFDLWQGLQGALQTIPDNFKSMGEWFTNPILASAPMDAVDQGIYGQMYQRFDGKIGAFAYLLFLLLYFPCVSTMAVMVRELNRAWAAFSMIWTTGLAYAAAVIFYQGATLMRHPASSIAWIVSCITVILLVPTAMYFADRTFTRGPVFSPQQPKGVNG